MKNKWFIPGILLLLFVGIICSGMGAMSISLDEILSIIGHQFGFADSSGFSETQEVVWLHIRLPRIIMAILVGAVLAVSGAVFQGLFRNPLASPALTGITSGSALGASVFFVLGGSYFFGLGAGTGLLGLSLFSFIGAILTGLVVLGMARSNGRIVVTIMLLAGVAMQAITSSLTGALTFVAEDDQLRDITFWLLGSLGGATWTTVQVLLPFAILLIVLAPFFSQTLNALSLGEQDAGLLGFNLSLTKFLLFGISTLAIGAAVAMTGMIGFVGLVIPHIIRMLVGVNHRHLIPFSALGGAILLVLADTLCRTIITPSELPIGIVTAALGGPLFIHLLVRQKKRFQLTA